MSETDLRRAIGELRAEIDRLDGLDAARRARLETLLADLERRLDDPAAAPSEHDLLHEVREAISYFEVEHPTATGILNHIMVTLGNLGI